MAEVRSLQEWQETVRPMLHGLSRFNPDIIGTLEEYVSFQAGGSHYDFEANLCLLKLYQFGSADAKLECVLQMLLKAITKLPKTDFVVLKCVLPLQLQRDESVLQVVTLHNLLESCQFKELWEELAVCLGVVADVTSFEDSIREYICSIVDVSYQTVKLDLLTDYLGGISEDVLGGVVSGRGWEIRGDTVFIRKQEEHIKPKKILPKIEFDSVSGILAAAAR